MKTIHWMRTLAAAMLLPWAWAGMPARAQSLPDETRQAIGKVGMDVQAALQKSGIPKNQPIAILPLANDPEQYVAGMLKNAVTAAGLPCVEGRDDPFWNQVLAEVEWSERKADMLDPATLTKFGKLKAAKLLLYGVVRDMSFSGAKGFVEIELHISAIETKQHLWGQTFARRFYVAKDMMGVVALDEASRKVLAKVFEQGLESLQKTPAAMDVKKSVVLVPLAGDVDRYVTQLTERMLTKTGKLTPREQDAQTLAQAKQLLRDEPQAADAILYGAVRDLSRQVKVKETADYTIDRLFAEVQLKLVAAKTGDVLWSDTLRAEYDDVTTKDTIREVLDKKKREVIQSVIDTSAKNPGKTAFGLGTIILLTLGGIVGLFLLLWILRILLRPR